MADHMCGRSKLTGSNTKGCSQESNPIGTQSADGHNDWSVKRVMNHHLLLKFMPAKLKALAFCFAAKTLTSCVTFMEQNSGPHIEQKCAVLASSAGRVWP
jgi:hypothetical protein